MGGRREKRQIKLSGELGVLGGNLSNSLRACVLHAPQHLDKVESKLGELGVVGKSGAAVGGWSERLTDWPPLAKGAAPHWPPTGLPSPTPQTFWPSDGEASPLPD